MLPLASLEFIMFPLISTLPLISIPFVNVEEPLNIAGPSNVAFAEK